MTNRICEIINAAADKAEIALKENSVLGDPITVDSTMIIPVYSLSFGFGGGGFDRTPNSKEKENLVGGAGAGVTKKPVSYIMIKDGDITILNNETKNNSILSKILSSAIKKGKTKQ